MKIFRYLVDDISLNMFPDYDRVLYTIFITEWHSEQFCKEIKSYDTKNAIRHQSTVEIVNQLCGTNFTPSNEEIHLELADSDDPEGNKYILYAIQINTQLPKTLTKEELERLIDENKIKLLDVEIGRISGIIEDLDYLEEEEEWE